MSGWNEAFPYRAEWPHNVDSREVFNWCDQTYSHWEYFNSEFRFQSEQDLVIFKLKWEK